METDFRLQKQRERIGELEDEAKKSIKSHELFIELKAKNSKLRERMHYALSVLKEALLYYGD